MSPSPTGRQPPARQLQWQLGDLALCLRLGDLFDSDADALVNSEQTDFILSADRRTLSGQIRHRCGPAIQAELNVLTAGAVLDPGCVLRTSGGERFRYVYHAGFHRPDQWLDEVDPAERDEHESGYVATVRDCLRRILGAMEEGEVDLLALPLIGSGRFGLDPALLTYDLFRELADLALRLPSRRRPRVEVTVREP
ncbi:MAG: macro domain-containing protein, partial [Candidatus Competibacterales bacterium]|nr:macro domain-containing protein [Candidatus Competibacterales bacterium]